MQFMNFNYIYVTGNKLEDNICNVLGVKFLSSLKHIEINFDDLVTTSTLNAPDHNRTISNRNEKEDVDESVVMPNTPENLISIETLTSEVLRSQDDDVSISKDSTANITANSNNSANKVKELVEIAGFTFNNQEAVSPTSCLFNYLMEYFVCKGTNSEASSSRIYIKNARWHW